MWYPTRKFCATLQWPAPFCVEKVEVASPSSRIELFGRMWLRTFPRRCGDLWDMYRYVVLPCYGIFMAWPRHPERIPHGFRTSKCSGGADECSDSSEPGMCASETWKKLLPGPSSFAPFLSFLPAEAWERNSLLTPTDVINWHGFGTTSVFAVHCWFTPRYAEVKEKEASLFEEIEKPFGPRSVEFQLRTEVLRLHATSLLWLAEVQRETPSGVPNFFFKICRTCGEFSWIMLFSGWATRMQWSGVMCLRRAGASGHRDPKITAKSCQWMSKP